MDEALNWELQQRGTILVLWQERATGWEDEEASQHSRGVSGTLSPQHGANTCIQPLAGNRLSHRLGFHFKPDQRGSRKQQSKIPLNQLLGTGEFFLIKKKKKGKTKTCTPERRVQNLPQGSDELQRAVPGWESTVGHALSEPDRGVTAWKSPSTFSCLNSE